MAEIEIYNERVDDVPLLVHHQQRMGIPETLDEVIQPHGNRQGLSFGWSTTFWLAYILSEADHRMSEVETWAAKQIELISALSPQPVEVKDFADDRLADVLRYLSQDASWEEVETCLGRRLIRVYNLSGACTRLDSTSVAVYHDSEGNTLFRYGRSKDHRPDLAQFKVMLGALDPMGLPMATLVVPGNRADDPLYTPTIQRSRQVIGQGGRLYIGDSKMAALETRAFLQAGGDYYLTALPRKGYARELLHKLLYPVWNRQQPLELIYASTGEGHEAGSAGTPKKKRLLGLGYETTRAQTAKGEGGPTTWQERLLVVFSPTLARAGRRGLEKRLRRAERELNALTPPRRRGRQKWEEQEPLEKAVQAILKKRRVEELLEVTYQREVERRTVRKYWDQPERVEERVSYLVQVQRKEAAIRIAQRSMGWRLYPTNAPPERLTLADACQFSPVMGPSVFGQSGPLLKTAQAKLGPTKKRWKASRKKRRRPSREIKWKVRYAPPLRDGVVLERESWFP